VSRKQAFLEDSETSTDHPDTGIPVSESQERLTRVDDVSEKAEDGRRHPWLGMVREVAETVLLTVVILLVINLVSGRFRIEGPSMRPNLHEGQYLIINKIVYRFQEPSRGDIIVFHHPNNTSRDLIKRIIGLPGETIDVRAGRVYVDGQPLEEPYVLQLGRYSGSYKVGPDEYFVLGDNRPNSDDSHNWGQLRREDIVGKAWISYWPPDQWGMVPHHGFEKSASAQHRAPGEVPQGVFLGVADSIGQSWMIVLAP
jgi:signal peptidase I